MKNILVFTVLFLLTSSVQGQLLNGSFEDLYTNDFGVKEAEHWHINNDSLHWWVYFDSIAYHLDHPALLLGYEADSGWTGCQSRLWQEVIDPTLQDGDVLSFYSYSHPTPGRGAEQPYFSADLFYYKEGVYLGKDTYEEESFSSTYSYKEIPVTIFDSDSLVVYFTSGAQPGAVDDCLNHTNTYVDKVELGAALTNANDELSQLTLFAYAAFGYVTIKGEVAAIEQYSIYDMSGQLVTRGSTVESSIRLPNKGIYILQVMTAEGVIQSLKFANL